MSLAPEQFRQITKERYTITKHTNTSYIDTAEMTPLERTYVLQFIMEDKEREYQLIQNQKQSISKRGK